MSTECPSCEYVHDVMSDEQDEKLNKEGRFYHASNSIEMERPVKYSSRTETKSLIGCPNCGTIFIDVHNW